MNLNFSYLPLLLLFLGEVLDVTSAWPPSPAKEITADDQNYYYDAGSSDSQANKTVVSGAFYESLYIDAYESMTAEEKQNMLFQELESSQGTKGNFPNLLGLAGLILGKGFAATMDTYSDFFPGKKGKGVHSVGPAAKFIFRPAVRNHDDDEDNDNNFNTDNSTTTNAPTDDTTIGTDLPSTTGSDLPSKKKGKLAHPFTGLFAENAYGMLRLSLAVDLKFGNFVPGIGVKLLRDGMPSANFVAMDSVDGQESGNFFEADFSNHIAKPQSVPQKLLGRKFAQTSSPPELVGLSDIATYRRNGEKVDSDSSRGKEDGEVEEKESKVVFPFELIVKPNEQLRKQYAKSAPTEEALEEALTSIPEGTIIYTLYGRAEPNDEDLILIGTFQLTSRLLYSKFSDNGLFFRHQRIEEDMELRPEWNDAIEDLKLQSYTGPSLRGRSLLGSRTTKSKCPMARLH